MSEKEKVTLCSGVFLNFVKVDDWEYIERTNATGAATIIGIDAENRIILTEQYRPPLGTNVIDLPAGIFGDHPGQEDESGESGARREFEEETGYHAEKLTYLFDSPSAAGTCSEVIQFYQAHNLTKVSDGGGLDDEDITVHQIPLNQLDQWLTVEREKGKLIDHKIFAALYLAKIGA